MKAIALATRRFVCAAVGLLIGAVIVFPAYSDYPSPATPQQLQALSDQVRALQGQKQAKDAEARAQDAKAAENRSYISMLDGLQWLPKEGKSAAIRTYLEKVEGVKAENLDIAEFGFNEKAAR